MNSFTVCFDIDGTLIKTDGTINLKVVELANVLIVSGAKVYVWSGGGLQYAHDRCRDLAIMGFNLKGATVITKGEIIPDVAIDDVAGVTLGKLNLIVQS